MRWRLWAVLAAALAAFACGGSASSTTTATTVPPSGAPSPAQAVAQWLDFLAADDYVSTARLVPDGDLALLIGVENSYSAEAAASLLVDGIPDEVRAAWWRSFVRGFRDFTGEELARLEVDEVEEFDSDGRGYALVEVGFGDRAGSTSILTQRRSEGRWWVDLLGTVGPGLARPLREWVEAIPDQGAGATVRAALGDAAPSLRVALRHPPQEGLPFSARRDLEILIRELEG
ncbi:MAG: hypothetical protein ACE5KX_05415 [Acidimicrobiia bacterium]